jgi:predicted Zn-dependent protease with MMP-like domain
MTDITDADFEALVAEAVAQVPQPYQDRLDNIAFIVEEEPSPAQRQKMALRPGETLFGLYEGVPLPNRGGVTKLLPDKITLFKNPLLAVSPDLAQLKRRIGHTVWHEVAHYFGLDHGQIDALDNKSTVNK